MRKSARIFPILLGLGGFSLMTSAWAAGSEADLKACGKTSGDVRIKACSRFIASEKDDKDRLSSAHFYRARAFARQKEYEKAISDYTISNGYFAHPINTYERGNSHMSLRQYDKAVADFTHTVERLPEHYWAYNNRGVAHQRLGKLELAVADFGQAIKEDPNPAIAYRNRAGAYLKWGKPALGLPDVEESLKLNPDAANGWHTKGRLLEALDERDGAIAAYREALRLSPVNQDSKNGLKRLGVTP